MKRIKAINSKISKIEVFEHLDYVVRNTTPAQRFQWLEEAWNFWYEIRKTLPKRVVELQDKLRGGKP
jgi:alpha-L-arabinofuranosidase